MGRAVCFCNPKRAIAGEISTRTLIYRPASFLPKGTLLLLDLNTKGRFFDWQIPEMNPKDGKNTIWAQLPNKKILKPSPIKSKTKTSSQFQFCLPSKLDTGQEIIFYIGTKDYKKKPKNGNRSQLYAQRRRPFYLYVDTEGKGNYQDPEVFPMDILGGKLTSIKIITPSFVQRNKRFDVVLRFEDQFGNLTNHAPEDTLIELSYENLRDNLNWKIFIPETGFLALPNLYFNETGIYTIQLLNHQTKQVFRSSPIKCFNKSINNLFWGLLHGESIRFDSIHNIENCLRHFRDEKSFNFYATSTFENSEEITNDNWKFIVQHITDFDEVDRFTTFLGSQWVGSHTTEGIRQFLFSKEAKSLIKKKDIKYSSLKKIYKHFSPKDLIAIPSFTMGENSDFNFEDHNPDFERVVEIYNAWGCSECTEKEGNPFPIKGNVKEISSGSVIEALKKNKRFGFIAGGRDDRGPYASFFQSKQQQYTPGLTAILAPEHTRTSIFEALSNRSCYATTGEKIILGIFIADITMGQETNTHKKHGFLINRYIHGYVAGTTDLEKIEIIRNGEVLKEFTPSEQYSMEFNFDDTTPLKDVCIDIDEKTPPFTFYYLRVKQKDGHMAWSSPIWIDLLPGKPSSKKASLEKTSSDIDPDS